MYTKKVKLGMHSKKFHTFLTTLCFYFFFSRWLQKQNPQHTKLWSLQWINDKWQRYNDSILFTAVHIFKFESQSCLVSVFLWPGFRCSQLKITFCLGVFSEGGRLVTSADRRKWSSRRPGKNNGWHHRLYLGDDLQNEMCIWSQELWVVAQTTQWLVDYINNTVVSSLD